MIKTIAGLQGVTVLGRDAQKKITGGVLMSCKCIGGVGEWSGNYTLGRGEVWDDIHAYCPSGHGWCNTVRA